MAPSNKKQETKDALRDSLRTKLKSETPNPEPGAGSAPHGGGRSKSLGEAFQAGLYLRGPNLAQMAAFCRQLATLVDVGIPLVQSLNTLAQRIEHPVLKRVVGDVARRVEEGNTFSSALAAHPKIFSNLVVNVVRIGETGGILEGSLKYLAEIMERRYEIRKRVAGALAYPTAALIVCGLAILVILGFAMPVFSKIYEGVAELPPITVFVLGLSTFVEKLWWLIIIVVAGAVWGIRLLINSSPETLRMWDAFKLRLPIVSGLSVKINVTRCTRTLANLLRAGIPLLEALSITAETSENLVYAEALQKTHDTLEQGGQMEKPLRDSGVFPDIVVDMISIGDEAGRLEIMFEKIADTYDSDVNLSIRTLNAILEPALIVLMGGIVLTLALAVLLPYWKIGTVLQE